MRAERDVRRQDRVCSVNQLINTLSYQVEGVLVALPQLFIFRVRPDTPITCRKSTNSKRNLRTRNIEILNNIDLTLCNEGYTITLNPIEAIKSANLIIRIASATNFHNRDNNYIHSHRGRTLCQDKMVARIQMLVM